MSHFDYIDWMIKIFENNFSKTITKKISAENFLTLMQYVFNAHNSKKFMKCAQI